MSPVLSHEQARRFYDRFGSCQDLQRFYEDVAIEDILFNAAFEKSRHVVEFGCGTGRLAERLLDKLLPPDAIYTGFDISRTMVALSRDRLARFGSLAQVVLTDGAPQLPLAEASCDRFISAYVFDLLSPSEAGRVAIETRRLLADGGRLCLASPAPGSTPISRAVQRFWEFAYRLEPWLVGGCRPVRLLDLVGPDWRILHRRVVSRFGLCSEVLVATKSESAREGTRGTR